MVFIQFKFFFVYKMSYHNFISNIVEEIEKNINEKRIHHVSFHVLLLDMFTKIIIVVNYYYPNETNQRKKFIVIQIIFKIVEKFFPDKKMYVQENGEVMIDLLLDFQKSYPMTPSCIPCLHFFK